MGGVRFCDKLLPTQPAYSNLFSGVDLEQSLYEAMTRWAGIVEPHEEFVVEQASGHTVPELGSNPVVLRFLQFLVRLSRAKKILEVGSFIGVSSMYLARATEGEVVTIEKFPHFAEIARRNFARNGVRNAILLEGDAQKVLPELQRYLQFDFAFLDGDKGRYLEYFKLIEPMVKGMVVIDDCFFHGDAVNAEPSTEKGRGVKALMEYLSESSYKRTMLPISNGLMIVWI